MEWINAHAISFEDVRITGGFWLEKQRLMREVTAMSVYDRFVETGRFAALRADWQEGKPYKPHIFWESDIAKWIEGVAYLLHKERDPGLEALVDESVALMEAYQQADGYLNVYFTVVEPGARFTRCTEHELYCAGHLIEAAVAYARATGKDALLRIVCRYVALIDRVFRVEQSAGFDTPGHEEIELALMRLYRYTGDARHRVLAEYFVDKRGFSQKDHTYDFGASDNGALDYMQAHLPVREQRTAEGHCVRALYLYCAMADLARENRDERLFAACDALFDNITQKRMYVTGGIGSTHRGEAFTYDYDLPSHTAYAETCASIALALFARRMWLIRPHGKYADAAELAVYNTVLAGISLSGDRFFYENPLAADPEAFRFQQSRATGLRERLPLIQRPKIFDCSCCPPNVMRFIASVADFMYSVSAKTVYAHCYMDGEATLRVGEETITIVQQTQYPYAGAIRLTIAGGTCGDLAVRIPAWSKRASISVDGTAVDGIPRSGYLHLGEIAAGSVVRIELDDSIRLVRANPRVRDACGRVAVMRGPLVYCAEGHDNPYPLRDVRVPGSVVFERARMVVDGVTVDALYGAAKKSVDPDDAFLYMDGLPALTDIPLTLIPYCAWANRGPSEMNIWFLQHMEADACRR